MHRPTPNFNYRVRLYSGSLADFADLFPTLADQREALRHLSKLTFFNHDEVQAFGMVQDLDCAPLPRAPGLWEVRIDDPLGGHDGLRLVVLPTAPRSHKDLYPTLWVVKILDRQGGLRGEDLDDLRDRVRRVRPACPEPSLT